MAAPKTSKTAKTPKAAKSTPATEASLGAFRKALESSVTISRERLQEVADDAVERGRMTRRDAEDLVGKVVSRGREGADELVSELERTLTQLRKELGDVRKNPALKADQAQRRAIKEVRSASDRARREVETVRRRTVGAVDQPLASADRVRRRSGLPGFPITAYDRLSVRQIAGRLTELTRVELARVREYERDNRARKGVLRAVEREMK